ncbi:MAG: hypothetical protein WBP22_03255 [Candidatus Saccharimonas sp.]
MSKLLSTKQKVYTELFVGTLIYVVVLGFLRDYTDIVSAQSFSSLFFASVVLEVLTFLTFQLKSQIVAWLRSKQGVMYRVLLFFAVWFIMFTSKFVFIAALDFFFGNYVYIHGFFGILFVVATVTILHKLSTVVFRRLADDHTKTSP